MMNVVRDQLNELHAGGQWLDVPFNAADYTASGMAWNVTAHSPSAYTIINKTMIYTIYLQTSMHSLAGATNSLAIKLPGNATCAKTAIGSGWSNGIAALSWTSIFPYARGGSQSITLHGPGLGNYNAGGWELYMTIALPIL
jgi:hypothetical protein